MPVIDVWVLFDQNKAVTSVSEIIRMNFILAKIWTKVCGLLFWGHPVHQRVVKHCFLRFASSLKLRDSLLRPSSLNEASVSNGFWDIQWRMWRNGWYDLNTTSKQRSRSFILVPIDFSHTTFYRMSVNYFCSGKHCLATIDSVQTVWQTQHCTERDR